MSNSVASETNECHESREMSSKRGAEYEEKQDEESSIEIPPAESLPISTVVSTAPPATDQFMHTPEFKRHSFDFVHVQTLMALRLANKQYNAAADALIDKGVRSGAKFTPRRPGKSYCPFFGPQLVLTVQRRNLAALTMSTRFIVIVVIALLVFPSQGWTAVISPRRSLFLDTTQLFATPPNDEDSDKPKSVLGEVTWSAAELLGNVSALVSPKPTSSPTSSAASRNMKNANEEKNNLVFDWANFTRPENYILFTQQRSRTTIDEDANTIRVDFTKPITWLGILFFVPVFSSEFFFAISRSFICNLPHYPDLCRAL
ncbi:hypothetical protein TrLO_g4162 [Triparma laevis f. longispina]|uniref:Uncharacterized protein n=1 Tax=Triparma laevis f. longispina TaxID=1714387 RepID=A0A9W7FHR7_9STRA|nr:hypothetical protein TrLO_g4162 [Triparma laevis f. longispina]